TGARILTVTDPIEDNVVPPSERPPETLGIRPNFVARDTVVAEAISAIHEDPEAAQNKKVVGYFVFRRVALNPAQPAVLDRLVGNGARVLIGNKGGGAWTDLAALVPSPTIDASIEGPRKYFSHDGVEHIGSVAHIAGVPWVVLVGVPRHLVVAPANQLLQQLSIIGVVFVVVASLVVWRLSASVTKPL